MERIFHILYSVRYHIRMAHLFRSRTSRLSNRIMMRSTRVPQARIILEMLLRKMKNRNKAENTYRQRSTEMCLHLFMKETVLQVHNITVYVRVNIEHQDTEKPASKRSGFRTVFISTPLYVTALCSWIDCIQFFLLGVLPVTLCSAWKRWFTPWSRVDAAQQTCPTKLLSPPAHQELQITKLVFCVVK